MLTVNTGVGVDSLWGICVFEEITLGLEDSDEDGLIDNWEINGVDTTGDGQRDLDLQALGANPNVKDIFVRIDWLEKSGQGGHNHKPSDEALNRVKDAFAKQGINLHIVLGTAIEETNDLEVLLSLVDFGFPAIVDIGLNTEEFIALREQHLLENGTRPGGASVFHYAIFGHYISRMPQICPTPRLPRPLGVAIPGTSDFIVALQRAHEEGKFSDFLEASVFMHELGHTLGLGHGGITPTGHPDHTNYKPNHLSVMNYSFTRNGLIFQGNPGLLDYSQFGPETIPDLRENGGLNENVGLNSSAIVDYGTKWFCGKHDSVGNVAINANGVIDWDCDPFGNTVNVKANINKDTINPLVCEDKYDDLHARNEWDNLDFNHGTVGTYVGVLPKYPSEVIVEGPDLPDEEILELPLTIYLPIILK